MTDTPQDMEQVRTALLDAIQMHVPFDGWSETAFRTAIAESGIEPGLARAACPRGAADLAVAYHKRGDDLMVQRLAETDLSDMRFRDRIALAVRFRLEAVEDKECVRRGATLFALPQYGAEGSKLIWGTADRIWTALGDTSEDVNWYTKRASLSAVYGATVLYWLGDDSFDSQPTWDFLDRRIEGVMRFEKAKARVRSNPLLKPLTFGPRMVGSKIKPPHARKPMRMPGFLRSEPAETA
ncbi:COQ9 family protein [Rhodovulum adriaticum]|uniref:Ubiquinone biosynthesis protein COQ9 n=1 Tax=Rhodovulum adriaticum TaxID=35804 RepID=A0A4R2P0A8_RHOAD|nr:COQ9 family protein [Rhodovulum adriaticum]MBK1634188.1 ubiquinone biosynthesis protein [Rhodovulum adriaticum]TCP27261.1 ubiquinone biosynthesis protein COQ9 [Rhodovulum adriaticum]